MCRYYVGKIAEQGLLGFAMATSPEFVAPFGAKQPVFGTNPIACAIPTPSGEPLVVDMATSAYTLFGLLEAKTAGSEIPDNVAYNSEVRQCVEPSSVWQMSAPLPRLLVGCMSDLSIVTLPWHCAG